MIKVALYEDNDSLRESLSIVLNNSEEFVLTGAFQDANQILKNCAINSEYVFLDTRRLKNSNRFKSNNENIQMARGYLDSLNDNVPLKDVVDVWYKYIEEKSHDIVNNICTENNLTEGNRYELWKQNNASL